MHRRQHHFFAFAFALFASLAFGQGAWFETGTLTTVVGGEARLLHTYGTLVPENVADGVTDPQQRAILEKVAGTEQHTATHMFMDEMTLGTVVLVPATIYVSLGFRHGGHDASAPGGMNLEFSLVPGSLAMGAEEDVQVRYYPNGPSYDDFYALTEGSLTLTAVEVVDDVTLSISGSFAGLLSHQSGYDVVHDPSDTIPVEGEFTVERVVGSQLALELIQGE